MNANAGVGSSTNEIGFELKYCERCGGLWLRPTGGGQIYCVACGRAMAELPRGSSDRENGRVKQRRQSEANDSGGHEWDEGIDVEVAGGVA
jgi:Zn-finger nucleic acid-binding protein